MTYPQPSSMRACFNSGSITCDGGHIKLAMETLEMSKRLGFVVPTPTSVSRKLLKHAEDTGFEALCPVERPSSMSLSQRYLAAFQNHVDRILEICEYSTFGRTVSSTSFRSYFGTRLARTCKTLSSHRCFALQTLKDTGG